MEDGVPIKDYPDYLIYRDGRVWSKKTNKYLKHGTTLLGYKNIELFNDKGHKRKAIHRLVAEAYIPNPNNYPQINHKDENPANNDVSNLEWCTAYYNMHYGEGAKTRHKKIDYSKPVFKEIAYKNSMALRRPLLMYTKDFVLVGEFESGAEASRQTGIYITSITRAAKKEHLKAGGYYWRYKNREE